MPKEDPIVVSRYPAFFVVHPNISSNGAHCSIFSPASEGSQGDKEGSHSPAVGSVVVTLEPRKKLTLGAFLTGGADQAWQFWEGEFGPSELAAHVRACLFWSIC